MRKLMLIALVPALFAVACNTPKGDNKTDKKAAVVKMNGDVMKIFETKKKDVAAKAKSAVGYACFSNTTVTFLFAGGGGGYGLATHNKTGKKTFMEAGSANLGLGLGAKDYRMLMIFNTEEAFQKFVQGTWSFGGSATAEATGGEGKGGGATASGMAKKAVETYQITDSGAILAATIKGGKFSPDKSLN